MLGLMKDSYITMESHLGHIFKILIFLGASIVEAESNKLNLETRDQNYLNILKALTLVSLLYSFSKYDISVFPRVGLQTI